MNVILYNFCKVLDCYASIMARENKLGKRVAWVGAEAWTDILLYGKGIEGLQKDTNAFDRVSLLI